MQRPRTCGSRLRPCPCRRHPPPDCTAAEALQKALVPGRKGGVAEEDPWQQRASRVELQEQRGRLEDAARVDQDADDRAGW